MVCARCAADQPIALDECDQSDVMLTCTDCGAPLLVPGARAAGGVVDSITECGPIGAELPQSPASLDGVIMSLRTHAATGERRIGLVVARPSLPALLWHQPAVRAVARAGAGAVALTVGMRLLRGWLASRPSGRRRLDGLATTALPLAHQVLEQHMGELERPARGDEVVETFVYVRRVLRRR